MQGLNSLKMIIADPGVACEQAFGKGSALQGGGTLESPAVAAAAFPEQTASRLRSELSQIPRILLVRMRSLGDSILTLPLVEALHEWRPELQLDVLIESPFAAVFSEHPAVGKTLVLKTRSWPAGGGWSKAKALLEVRRHRYPVVVNLHGGPTSQLLTVASGAGHRIGYGHYRRSWAYDVRIPSSSNIWKREDIHTVEHLLSLLRWLDIPIADVPRGDLHIEERARVRVRQRLEHQDIRRRGFILVHPTATLFTKQWPPEYFAFLADRLREQYRLPAIFTSGPAENRVLLDIARCAHSQHHYWSDLALNELFALIEGCRLFVGNDSGPTHAAAALRRPVVVVWGSSNARAWRPWGTDYELIHSELPCMPCPGYTCAAFGKPRCILEIPVERVFQACQRILGRTSVE